MLIARPCALHNHPDFRSDDWKRAENGKIGQHDVIWYDGPSPDSSRPISRQALVQLGRRPDSAVAHIWFSVANVDELKQVIGILQRMSFN